MFKNQDNVDFSGIAVQSWTICLSLMNQVETQAKNFRSEFYD